MPSNLNVVALVGNLTKDVELRHIPSGTAVATLRIAVNDRVKKQGEWTEVGYYFNVTVWGNAADACARYLSKGKKVGVTGKLTWREWEKDGVKREAVEVVADNVQFLTPADEGGGGGSYGGDVDHSRGNGGDTEFAGAAAGTDFGGADDDIPF